MQTINIDNMPYKIKEYFGTFDNIKTVVGYINDKLVLIDPSGNVALSLGYIDGSLSKRDVSIAFLKTYMDGSLNLKSSLTYVNSSLGARDTSIAYLNTKSIASDVSIAFLDASKAYKSYVDGSLNVKTSFTYVDASLNARANITYVNSSLGARDTSIAFLDASKAYKSYVDSSLGARDTSIAYLNANKGTAVGTIPTADASGISGNLYFDVSTAYMKIGTKWYKWPAVAAF